MEKNHHLKTSLQRLSVFVLGMFFSLSGGYVLWSLGGCDGVANRQAGRSSTPPWAERLELAGVGNFHRVSPTLYRGAQPTAEGMNNLQAMGIRTVINLRELHSDRDEIGQTALGYQHIHFDPLHPEDEDVVRFLKIAADSGNQPVFVHCAYGSDRTGMMCAAYRVAVQGWTKEQALAEWTQGDFGFHDAYQNLLNYFQQLDIQKIRQQAALN